jgi:hypothetical protein
VLVTEVSFGEKKVLEESGVYLTGTYDLSSWERKEARLMDVKLKELKATGAVRSDCRATIATEGKGFNQTGRSVEGPDDWEEVEKLVKSFIDGGRKQVRVLLAVRYALPASEEDGDTDADSVLSGEEEHPTNPGPAPKKKRRTATEVEKEKARREQAKEKNYVTELMTRWRCAEPRCAEYGKGENQRVVPSRAILTYVSGACLRLPGETQCRPMPAQLLGQWNEILRKGRGTVDVFPIDQLKLPPMRGGSKAKQQEPATPQAMPGAPNFFFGLPGLQQAAVPGMLSPYAPSHPYYPRAVPSSPILTRDTLRESSPIRPTAEESPDELLDAYFKWYLRRNCGGEESTSERALRVKDALTALKDAFWDLEGVKGMKMDGWEQLGVPSGIGAGLSRDVRAFMRSRR